MHGTHCAYILHQCTVAVNECIIRCTLQPAAWRGAHLLGAGGAPLLLARQLHGSLRPHVVEGAPDGLQALAENEALRGVRTAASHVKTKYHSACAASC